MKILSYNECAERAGIVRRTFERTLADGTGPAIVDITARRRGVLEDDFNAWLLSRRRPAPGSVAAAPALTASTDGAPAPKRRGRPPKVVATTPEAA